MSLGSGFPEPGYMWQYGVEIRCTAAVSTPESSWLIAVVTDPLSAADWHWVDVWGVPMSGERSGTWRAMGRFLTGWRQSIDTCNMSENGMTPLISCRKSNAHFLLLSALSFNLYDVWHYVPTSSNIGSSLTSVRPPCWAIVQYDQPLCKPTTWPHQILSSASKTVYCIFMACFWWLDGQLLANQIIYTSGLSSLTHWAWDTYSLYSALHNWWYYSLCRALIYCRT